MHPFGYLSHHLLYSHKYESLPEWDRYNHDIEYIDDYNNDFDDNRDCYKLEHWIKFQEINREKFFEIEEYDLCKTDKDYQKLKEEKSKWLKCIPKIYSILKKSS